MSWDHFLLYQYQSTWQIFFFFSNPHEDGFHNAYIYYNTVALISVKHQNILQM